MNKLQELIDKLCPNGVKYKKIKDFTKVLRGKRLTTRDIVENGKYPIYHGGIIPIGYYNDNNRVANTVMIINVGASAGTVGYCEEDFWASDGCFCIEKNEIINDKFLYYYLQMNEKNLKSKVRKAGIPTLDNKVVENLSIPIPPIEIQFEVVNILDKLEEYIYCLKKELNLRENAYVAIMYPLLKKENFEKFDILENYCYFEKGKTPIQKNNPGVYPLVATTEYLQTSDNYQFDCETVCLPLISARGHGVASITRIFFQSGKFALGNILCAIIPKDNQIKAEFLRNYLFYYKDILLVPLMRGGANVALTIDSLRKVQIPIPSIEQQENIIGKIRKFQEIISKETGLPVEIEKRQKQYEYYRDKLLSFKEVEVNE
ncbi:MAG: restriction endonuclease subunit S [Clostridia bacterium]|nr:restriction endonuclease subunit S [Clostridia bacterium]